MPVDPFFTGLLSAGTSLIGSIQSGKNIDKQIAAQQEENRKNREYNLMLANLQNQWNVEQWERENEYNDPSAQMARYVKAGLNPDLIYGQGASSISARSPELTAGAPSSPVDMSALGQKPTIGQAATMALQNMAIAAQARKTIAESEKTVEETEGQRSTNKILASDAAFRDAWNSGQIRLQGLNIDLAGANVKLTEANTKEAIENVKQIQANVNRLRSEVEKVHSEISLMTAQEYESIVRSDAVQKKLGAEIEALQSQAGLSRAEARRVIQMLPYQLANAGMSGQLLGLEIEHQNGVNSLLSIEKQSASLQLQLDRKFSDDERRAALQYSDWGQWLTPLSNAVSIIGGALLLRGKAPVKIKGFGR